MNELQQLKKEIEELKAWKASLENAATIPLEIDQAFRERFLSGVGLQATGTGSPSSTLSYNSFNVIVPANPSGTLKVEYGGTIYELLYK